MSAAPGERPTAGDGLITLSVTINGAPRELRLPAYTRMLDVLRTEFGLTGAKPGCGVGRCGACSVIVDGAAVPACLLPAHRVQNASVETIEGIVGDEVTRRVTDALLEHAALQCGYCTPGIVATLSAALRARPERSVAELGEALSGNLCRCTGYGGLQRALQALAD